MLGTDVIRVCRVGASVGHSQSAGVIGVDQSPPPLPVGVVGVPLRGVLLLLLCRLPLLLPLRLRSVLRHERKLVGVPLPLLLLLPLFPLPI